MASVSTNSRREYESSSYVSMTLPTLLVPTGFNGVDVNRQDVPQRRATTPRRPTSATGFSRQTFDSGTFYTTDELDFDLSEGTSEDSRKHLCPTCGKRFQRPSSLRIHANTHTGATPYSCPHPGCGRAFNVASNMRRHFRKHAETAGSSSSASSPSPSIPSHSPSLCVSSSSTTSKKEPAELSLLPLLDSGSPAPLSAPVPRASTPTSSSTRGGPTGRSLPIPTHSAYSTDSSYSADANHLLYSSSPNSAHSTDSSCSGHSTDTNHAAYSFSLPSSHSDPHPHIHPHPHSQPHRHPTQHVYSPSGEYHRALDPFANFAGLGPPGLTSVSMSLPLSLTMPTWGSGVHAALDVYREEDAIGYYDEDDEATSPGGHGHLNAEVFESHASAISGNGVEGGMDYDNAHTQQEHGAYIVYDGKGGYSYVNTYPRSDARSER